LDQRVSPAPEELIDYIVLDNLIRDYDVEPLPAEPRDDAVSAALASITTRLSQPVRELAEDRIVGVFLVENLGSTGYCELVAGPDGEPHYAFIVLDREVLAERTANEWASWKENSMFRPDGGTDTELSVVLEYPADDTRQNAIRYILLHEMGHALGLLSGAHPSWFAETPAEAGRYPFVDLSWRPGPDGDWVSRYIAVFPEQPLVRAYAFHDAPLHEDHIPEVYRGLAATDYPSLHGSSTLFEDFAESFASYQHAVRDGRPWRVVIQRPDAPPQVFSSPWADPRMDDKKAFMARWFENPVGGASGAAGD
jgi:hypothetical protein